MKVNCLCGKTLLSSISFSAQYTTVKLSHRHPVRSSFTDMLVSQNSGMWVGRGLKVLMGRGSKRRKHTSRKAVRHPTGYSKSSGTKPLTENDFCWFSNLRVVWVHSQFLIKLGENKWNKRESTGGRQWKVSKKRGKEDSGSQPGVSWQNPQKSSYEGSEFLNTTVGLGSLKSVKSRGKGISWGIEVAGVGGV